LADTANSLPSVLLALWAASCSQAPVRRVRLEAQLPPGSRYNDFPLAFEDGKSLYHGMKLLTLLALLFLVAFSPLAVASPRHPATHITRNEAQHLALQDHPGGRVTAANLDRSRGRPVWRIEIAEPNANAVVHLSVDATSGRVLSRGKASR